MARFELHKLEDLSDSRELLEQNPRRFTSWFIYLLCLILISFIIWAWFSTKSVVVSAQGIVESNKPVQTIAPISAGTVKSVNYANGSHVEKGDVIVNLDTQNLSAQLDSLNEQKSSLASQISDLNSLKQSVSEGNNFENDKSGRLLRPLRGLYEDDEGNAVSSSASLNWINSEISAYNEPEVRRNSGGDRMGTGGLIAMKLRYKKWCQQYGIPPQKVTFKFWLTGQYGKTRSIVKKLEKAEALPIPKAPKL